MVTVTIPFTVKVIAMITTPFIFTVMIIAIVK
jgi:hypothetical protein